MTKPETFVLVGEQEGDYEDHYQRPCHPLAAAASEAELEAFWEDLPGDPKVCEDESYIAHHIVRVPTL